MSAAENVSPLVARNVQYQNSRNDLIAASEKNPAIATYTAQLVCPHSAIAFHSPFATSFLIISAKFPSSDEHVDESKLHRGFQWIGLRMYDAIDSPIRFEIGCYDYSCIGRCVAALFAEIDDSHIVDNRNW